MKLGFGRLLCFLFILVAPTQVFGSGGRQPFSVTLKAPDGPLKAGSELVLRATIKNISHRGMDFATSLGLVPADWFRYQIHVLDADGHAAPPSARILDIRRLEKEAKKGERPALPAPPSSNTIRPLKPGESFVDEIEVTKDYNMSRPGIYKIWVVRPVPTNVSPLAPRKYWTGFVRSNTITVTVVE